MAHGAESQEGRPRGRPQRLPIDEHTIDSGKIDSDKRLAWLIATNRLMAKDSAWAIRGQFILALENEGLSVDSSRLSRWEAGTVRPSSSVLRAYEQRCGLPDSSFIAADRLTRRTAGSRIVSDRFEGDVTAHEFDDLLERLESERDFTGGDWLRLASGLANMETVYLHSDLWNLLCARLVNELTRSSGVALLRRYEAATQLLTHRRAPRHLMRALGEMVMHPDVQNVAPALTLLREVGAGAAADLVIRLIMGTDPLLRRGASIAAGGLAARHAFEGESLEFLERYVCMELRRPGDVMRRLDILDIATQLPDGSFNRLLATSDARTRRRLTRVRATGELASPSTAHSVPDQMAAAAEQALGRHVHDPDQMLRRLLREALFHVQRERRHLGATLISLSPYGPPIAAAALELTRSDDEVVARTSWSILRRLGHLTGRDAVAASLNFHDHPTHLAHGMVTLGLATGPMDEDISGRLVDAVIHSSRDGVRHAALFALGMSGHHRLHELADGHDKRAASAAWWLETGPSVHDVDLRVSQP